MLINSKFSVRSIELRGVKQRHGQFEHSPWRCATSFKPGVLQFCPKQFIGVLNAFFVYSPCLECCVRVTGFVSQLVSSLVTLSPICLPFCLPAGLGCCVQISCAISATAWGLRWCNSWKFEEQLDVVKSKI